jgi:all-trans-retinol 13,14-reductase
VILDHGGEVQREQEAVRFQFEGREAVAVELADGSRVAASAFISGIHPTQTLELVEAGRFRKAYVSRIRELENTMGSFCVYLSLKKKSFGNIPSNVFISQTRKVWTAGEYDHMEWPGACMLYTIPDRQDPEYAESMTISTFMKYGDVKRWEDSGVEKRGEAYLAFKQERAARLISLARSRFSELEGAIEDHYAATPLTFRDYTGIPEGSAYGILKDCNHPRRSYISPNTRVPNLFLTGQNSGVGLHGVLGVTVSALFTCAQFLDIGKLLEEIRNEY